MPLSSQNTKSQLIIVCTILKQTHMATQHGFWRTFVLFLYVFNAFLLITHFYNNSNTTAVIKY